MTKETLEALQDSIEKWEGIAEDGEEDLGCLDCPLCGVFLRRNHCLQSFDTKRKKCPVNEDTGQGGCLATPVIKWIKHHEDKHWSDNRVVRCPECEKLAQAEVKYLTGLLPKHAG
ncbi:hypothetical protein LCGC14_2595110 [marine sediment metagenome]|uniref:Uncharacterized protein n=1 Tax=marine sediment metagenome TaxID=412755 RepID=A0A0F9D342_9ZZZZ